MNHSARLFSVLFLLGLATVAMAAVPVPITPVGRFTESRRPVFKWTDTGAERYYIELQREKIAGWGHLVQGGHAWTPLNDLAAGRYRWHVKSGYREQDHPWSPWVDLVIPPAAPVPIKPAGWFNQPSYTPVFQWSSSDFDANRFKLEFFSGPQRLGSLSVKGFSKSIFTVAWTSAVPLGNYSWRVRAEYLPEDPYTKVCSAWSARTHFSVGVPGITTILSPREGTVYSPGSFSLPLVWTASPGADDYTLWLGLNGQTFTSLWHVIGTNHTLVADFAPGYYTFSIHPRNATGKASWSDVRSFEVNRPMKPGGGNTYAASPAPFSWVRSRTGTRYRLRLDRYDSPSAAYVFHLARWIPSAPGTPSWSPDESLPDGAYRWRITDYDDDLSLYTSTAYFQVGVPGRPALLHPLGPAFGQKDMLFVWGIPVGSPTDYQVRIWKGTTLIEDSGWKSVTNFTKPPPSAKTRFSFPNDGGGHYRWAVRARNARGPGAWDEGQFILTPLAAPVITKPVDGSVLTAGSGSGLSWKAVPGASYYEVVYRVNDVYQKTIYVSTSGGAVESTDWTVPVGAIEFKIRARNDGAGPWSSVVYQGVM